MRPILWWLGVLFGFAVARSFDAAWVMFFYVGDRSFPFVLQVVLDAVWLGAVGFIAGMLARWLAGWTSLGIGLALAISLLIATATDLILGIANEPWWHEAVTALVMVPAGALGGGFRIARRSRLSPVPR